MTGLVDFLLARIAEDEAMAPDFDDGDPCYDCGGSRFGRQRVEVECKVKRRLITIHDDTLWSNDEDYDPPREGCYACDGPCVILSAVALPYVDHPDYREEWRR